MQRFAARTRWTGSTGGGWESYDRAHEGRAAQAEQAVALTTAESHGDERLLNPEALLAMAASSCQLLWFLHLAAKARIDVVEYEDEALAEMPDDRITRIELRPRIVVTGDVSEERVAKLARQAHEHCNIAHSLSGEVVVEPRVERR